MNFFEAQERSYRNTRWLIGVMSLAVAAVVASVTAVVSAALWLTSSPAGAMGFGSWISANGDIVGWTAVGTAIFVGLASLYRVTGLRQGGGKVARDIGGPW